MERKLERRRTRWTLGGILENGQLKHKGNYKNYKEGKKEGLWEYYDEEGNLTKTEEYKDGVLHQ